VNEDSTSIILNTNAELTIQEVEIKGAHGTITKDPKISSNKDDETTTFGFQDSLKKGSKAQLRIKFNGILNDNLAGSTDQVTRQSRERRSTWPPHRWSRLMLAAHFHVLTSQP